MRKLITRYGDRLCGMSHFFKEENLRGYIQERRALNLTNLTKALHVLEYLGQLRQQGLDPLFKGGSAVQLLLPGGWQRLSTDLDLALDVPREEIEKALGGIHRKFGGEYYSYSPRKERESDVPFYNYRITIPTLEGEAVVLLDIIGEDIRYESQRKRLMSFFYESDTHVRTPTIDAILGDKLSTVGPETVGRFLRDSRNGLEYVKHIYDIRQLLLHVEDLGKVFDAYEKSHRLQLRIRDVRLDVEDSMRDLINVCRFLTLTDETARERTKVLGETRSKIFGYFRKCRKGLDRFQPFLTRRNVFTWENLRETAGIIAFVTRLMRNERTVGHLRSVMEAAPRLARKESVIDRMIEEIASKQPEESWHIDPMEIKESPILAVYWYGFWFPGELLEYVVRV